MSTQWDRRRVLGALGMGLAGAAATGSGTAAAQTRKPNVVIIFADDQGYGDLGVYGAQGYTTPHLDKMAAEGVRFTDFHASTAVCSASRISLLTGCYHVRVGIHGALSPRAKIGISDEEVTIAEILKAEGYATAIYGKWHLGHHPKFLPTQHGFDEYFGLPYSNDMWPKHPTAPAGRYPPLPLMRNEEVVRILEDDQSQLTTWYTEHAVDFIHRNAQQPFFLYVPHSMPHVPLFVSDKFKGKSEQGMYGDVIMEIDWSVGQILAALEETGVAENTLVIYTSDNGPWLSYGDHAGTTGGLREGKGTMFEGGMREPCIMRWPGRIPAGTVCDELATMMDILPTVTKLAGGTLPDHTIDGHDIWPLMSGQPGAKSPTDVYYCYYGRGELQGLRSGQWKLYFPHTYRTLDGRPGGTGGIPVKYTQARTGLELYDLKADLFETTNVADQHPDVVQRLEGLAEYARAELGDQLTQRVGKGVRPVGRL